MTSPQTHATHPQVRNRLKRADGHLHNVVAMIDGGKPCIQIVQQLHAVEKAISAAKKALIYDHLDHCLEDAVQGQSRASGAAVAEFKDITKYL